MSKTDEVRNYADLQRLMHDALRAQHPEWTQPDGESPICDDYDSRFAELLNLFSETADHWKANEANRRRALHRRANADTTSPHRTNSSIITVKDGARIYYTESGSERWVGSHAQPPPNGNGRYPGSGVDVNLIRRLARRCYEERS